MSRLAVALVGAVVTTLTLHASASAQAAPEAVAGSPQKAAMHRLDFLRGVWVGPATGTNRNGSDFAITQTERIGPMLDGDLMVVEGRGYEADGKTAFNAFAVISWNTQTNSYEMRSYAQGYAGTFPLTVRDDGYNWEIPAGPGVVRYTSQVTATTFHEVGEFVMPNQPPRQTFEMTLTRRGDTDWPAADPVTPDDVRLDKDR